MTLAAIWQAIQVLMKILPLVLEAIERGQDFIELRIALKKVDQAIDKAKLEDDTRPLNNLFPK